MPLFILNVNMFMYVHYAGFMIVDEYMNADLYQSEQFVKIQIECTYRGQFFGKFSIVTLEGACKKYHPSFKVCSLTPSKRLAPSCCNFKGYFPFERRWF